MTHLYMGHDSSVHGTWLIHIRWHDASVCVKALTRISVQDASMGWTWLFHVWDMTHPCVRHDSSMSGTRNSCMCTVQDNAKKTPIPAQTRGARKSHCYSFDYISYEYVMCHICMSHVTRRNTSRGAYICMSHVTRDVRVRSHVLYESCHMQCRSHVWVMSHVMHDSCHT